MQKYSTRGRGVCRGMGGGGRAGSAPLHSLYMSLMICKWYDNMRNTLTLLTTDLKGKITYYHLDPGDSRNPMMCHWNSQITGDCWSTIPNPSHPLCPLPPPCSGAPPTSHTSSLITVLFVASHLAIQGCFITSSFDIFHRVTQPRKQVIWTCCCFICFLLFRSAAERQAVNTRVQGSAADLVKVVICPILN